MDLDTTTDLRRFAPFAKPDSLMSKERSQEESSLVETVKDRTSVVPSEKNLDTTEPIRCLMCKQRLRVADEDSAVVQRQGAVNIDSFVKDQLHQLPPAPNTLPERHNRFEHSMPPASPNYTGDKSLFLAGSIEMGKAVQWQKQMANALQDLPITVCNPRRGHWDPNATSSAKDEKFRHQVLWELSALEKVDLICFFFDADTVSGVTMIEFGLWAASGKIVACCDDRFWRAGNIHLVCERYGVPCVKRFDDLAHTIKVQLGY